MTRQNYYARRRRRQRREADKGLIRQLVEQERQMQPRLGTRKLHKMLSRPLGKADVQIGRDRFFEVMRELDLLLEPLRSETPRTTCSYHYLPVFANLVREREFHEPNEAWAADITYLRTREGFVYLALLTDMRSRKIVGYHCGDTLEALGCVKALEMALENLPKDAHPIHHSDRGIQYCSHEYVNRLRSRGLSISMTEHDHCAENALAERVNGILKSEYSLGAKFETKKQADGAVKQAVHLYNTRRPHLALNYAVPETVHSLAA
jgi:transposase InsO family protein